MKKIGEVADNILYRLGISTDGRNRRYKPSPSSEYHLDELNSVINEANENRIDLQDISNGQIPGIAPIPVPGFPGPQDIKPIAGVNTIPGLKNFNYLVSFIRFS